MLGAGDYDLEWIERFGGTRSRLDIAALGRDRALRRRARAGRAALRRSARAGFTDSHWLREAFGTVAYGFFPARAMEAEVAARLIHSADERVPVDDLELGVEFLRAAARAAGSA